MIEDNLFSLQKESIISLRKVLPIIKYGNQARHDFITNGRIASERVLEKKSIVKILAQTNNQRKS